MTNLGQILERLQTCAGLSQRQIDWLTAQGVSTAAIAQPDALATAKVVFDGRCRFAFADEVEGGDSVDVIIFAERDVDGSLFDLIGWQPRNGQAGSWLGKAAWCGLEPSARLDLDGGLFCHRSPLDWLSSDRNGLWVFDGCLAALSGLAELGPFAVSSEADRRWLEKITVPPRVKITVRQAFFGRAAA